MSTATVTEAKILTAETVPAYLKEYHRESLQGTLFTENDSDEVTATAILGGNVNYAFCVTNQTSQKTVFVKQAPEFVAVFGPDGFPLTSERMQQEMDVYAEWKDMLTTTQNAKYLPEIYFFDKAYMVVCMEFLEGYTLLDHVLVDADMKYHANFGSALGDFMGQTHAATHSSVVSAERKAYLVEHYENRPMRDIQLEFVFTKCYKEATDEQRQGVTVNEAFLAEIETLKQQYDGKTDSLVLSHGDLHPGSVMVDAQSGAVRVIDPEFTVYGPPGLDVGSLLSGYILGAIHQAYNDNAAAVAQIVQGVRDLWQAYTTALTAGGLKDPALHRAIEIETVGFTVAEVCRTAMEFAGGRKWLQFDEDPAKKAAAKKSALSVVDQCMIARHEGGLELLLRAVTDVTSQVTEK